MFCAVQCVVADGAEVHVVKVVAGDSGHRALAFGTISSFRLDAGETRADSVCPKFTPFGMGVPETVFNHTLKCCRARQPLLDRTERPCPPHPPSLAFTLLLVLSIDLPNADNLVCSHTVHRSSMPRSR